MLKSKIIFPFVVCGFLLSAASPAFAKFPNVVKHAEGDIRYTFGYWPVLLIGGGALTAGLLTQADHSVQGHFKTKHLGVADDVAGVIGEPYVLDPAALVLFGAGQLSHNEKLSVTGETLLESLLFTDAMSGILKLSFHRKRPNGGNYSFPSNHAASMFAVATSLETLYGPIAGVPAYMAAGFVSFTRLDQNAHYLSDVVFGAALGSAIGWGTSHFHKLENPKLFFIPSVAGGAGFSVAGRF